MLLIDVHQLDVILADSVRIAALKDEVDDIGRIFSFQCKDVFILGCSQNFGQRVEIDAKGNVAVASEGREHLCFEHHRHKGDMGVVHGLEGDAGVIAVKIAVLDEIFDGIDDLLKVSNRHVVRGMFSPSSAVQLVLNVLPTLRQIS